MLESLIVGGVDLTYEVESKTLYSFPNAVKRPEALADEAMLGREVVDAYDLAPFTLTLHSGSLADGAAVASWLSARKRLFSPLTAMTLTESGAAPLTSYVRTAQAESPENHGTWGRLIITGIRYPDWCLPLRACVDENGHAIDGTDHSADDGHDYSAWPLGSPAKVRGAVGETYGRLQGKVCPAQASESIVLDCLPNPPADHAPTQDYQGTSDAAAKSGEAATATMTGTFAAVGTAATFDTNANRGDKAVFARVKNNAATGPTSLKAVSSVTGSGVAASSTYPGQEVRMTQNNDGYELVPLGVVPVPAGPVPGITTGAGYGAEGVLASDLNHPSSFAFSSGYPGVAIGSVTFATPKYVTALEFWTVDEGRAFSLFLLTAGAAVASGSTESSVAGANKCPAGQLVPAGTYTLYLVTTVGDHYSGTGPTDAYFKVYGADPLGFNSSIAVHAKCAESSKTASVDMVSVLSADFCEHAFGPFAADQGVLIDNTPMAQDERMAYGTTTTAGTAYPAVRRRTYGELAVPPGDSDWTPIADVPKDAAPTTCKLELSYIPVVINRVGGE